MTIAGTYPCCGGSLWLTHADDQKMPAWRPEDCPHCGAKVWHQLSRVWPMTFTEADFLAEFDVDEAAGIIRRRPGATPSSPVLEPVTDAQADALLGPVEA